MKAINLHMQLREVSGVCEICSSEFTKKVPRSVKKAKICADQECRREQNRRKAEQRNKNTRGMKHVKNWN